MTIAVVSLAALAGWLAFRVDRTLSSLDRLRCELDSAKAEVLELSCELDSSKAEVLDLGDRLAHAEMCADALENHLNPIDSSDGYHDWDESPNFSSCRTHAEMTPGTDHYCYQCGESFAEPVTVDGAGYLRSPDRNLYERLRLYDYLSELGEEWTERVGPLLPYA